MTAGITYRSEKDKYENDVSIITLENGRTFRMVHHSQSYQPKQFATIYAGRGKFVKVKTFSPSNECIPTDITVAGYLVGWGDGDNLHSESNPVGPDITEALREIQDDDFEKVILAVLTAIENVDAVWQRKDPNPS